jgi:hypothetical protein
METRAFRYQIKSYDELNAALHKENLVFLCIFMYRCINSPIKSFNEVIAVGYVAEFASFRFLYQSVPCQKQAYSKLSSPLRKKMCSNAVCKYWPAWNLDSWICDCIEICWCKSAVVWQAYLDWRPPLMDTYVGTLSRNLFFSHPTSIIIH